MSQTHLGPRVHLKTVARLTAGMSNNHLMAGNRRGSNVSLSENAQRRGSILSLAAQQGNSRRGSNAGMAGMQRRGSVSRQSVNMQGAGRVSNARRGSTISITEQLKSTHSEVAMMLAGRRKSVAQEVIGGLSNTNLGMLHRISGMNLPQEQENNNSQQPYQIGTIMENHTSDEDENQGKNNSILVPPSYNNNSFTINNENNNNNTAGSNNDNTNNNNFNSNKYNPDDSDESMFSDDHQHEIDEEGDAMDGATNLMDDLLTGEDILQAEWDTIIQRHIDLRMQPPELATIWPRDKLFDYLATMEKLNENIHEREEICRLVSLALLNIHDTD